ncbi:MAG: SPOR domain-containing protein [Stenotrophobium sp.]
MAKDYAQRGGNRRQARPRNGGARGAMPGWVWLALGLSLGLAVAAFVYIGRPAQPLPGQTAQGRDNAANAGESAQEKNPKSDTFASSKRNVVKLPPKEKPRFTFYELLPSQEVVVPREEVQGAGKNGGADSGLFIIQVASYRGEPEADAEKAKLALLGIESRIEKVTIDNKDTYYRVRIGPDSSLAHVHTIAARLEANGMQAMVVKVK